MGKNKRGQKAPEITWPGQREAEPNGKNGKNVTTEAVPHSQSQVETNDKEPQKMPEVECHDQSETEPTKIHYDIYRFLCHWTYVFMCIFGMAFMVMVLSGDNLLRTNYDGNLWLMVLKICFIYLIAAVCALLALKELPDLLDFILKFAGVLSFFTVGIFTVVILSRSNWSDIVVDETFVNGVNSMCGLWWILITSLVATVVNIGDASQLKLELRCFLNFITICGGIFFLILSVLMFLAIGNGNNLFGIILDGFFLKFAVILSVIHFQVFTSVMYVKYSLRNDSGLFQLAA